jgi:nicotinamide-nucleotide amidase
MSPDLARLAEQLLILAKERGESLVAAESCTGGMLAQTLADAPGAATLFHGSFVTYTKEHKCRALGVPLSLLRQRGAVCTEVAHAMAAGALRESPAGLSAAITGVAGPEPDEDGNPVGHVCIAVARRHGVVDGFARQYGAIGRERIRCRATADALQALMEMMLKDQPG